MLDRVVAYLRAHTVPFRLYSHPSPEPLPKVAHPIPRGGVMVDTAIVLVAGRPAIVCFTHGAQVSLPALSAELGVDVLEGDVGDLPAPFSGARAPIPGLGGALGTITIVDETAMAASVLVFGAFADTDFIEIGSEDFARLEQPRIAPFAVGGELPEHLEPTKSVA